MGSMVSSLEMKPGQRTQRTTHEDLGSWKALGELRPQEFFWNTLLLLLGEAEERSR